MQENQLSFNVLKCNRTLLRRAMLISEALFLHGKPCPDANSAQGLPCKNKACYSPETQHGRQVTKVYRPFPSCFEPHYESEAPCVHFMMKITFNLLGNETSFHMKSFALRKATQKWLM